MATKLTIVDDDKPGTEAVPIDGPMRDAMILELKAQGQTVRAIASQMGMSQSSVHKARLRALARIPSEHGEDHRRQADIEIDAVLREMHAILRDPGPVTTVKGDVVRDADGNPVPDREKRIRAAEVILKAVERRLKMHGADAPRRQLTATIDSGMMSEYLDGLRQETGIPVALNDPRVLAAIEAGDLGDDFA